jgi:hypothetical protein
LKKLDARGTHAPRKEWAQPGLQGRKAMRLTGAHGLIMMTKKSKRSSVAGINQSNLGALGSSGGVNLKEGALVRLYGCCSATKIQRRAVGKNRRRPRTNQKCPTRLDRVRQRPAQAMIRWTKGPQSKVDGTQMFSRPKDCHHW